MSSCKGPPQCWSLQGVAFTHAQTAHLEPVFTASQTANHVQKQGDKSYTSLQFFPRSFGKASYYRISFRKRLDLEPEDTISSSPHTLSPPPHPHCSHNLEQSPWTSVSAAATHGTYFPSSYLQSCQEDSNAFQVYVGVI